MTARLRLKRSDGDTYMERWGVECRLGGVFVHRFNAEDPGLHTHNHPFRFSSLVLKGGYVERRHDIGFEDYHSGTPLDKGSFDTRQRWSWKKFHFHEAHRIVAVEEGTTWTLVIHGRRRPGWGFFTPEGYVPHEDYTCPDLWEETP